MSRLGQRRRKQLGNFAGRVVAGVGTGLCAPRGRRNEGPDFVSGPLLRARRALVRKGADNIIHTQAILDEENETRPVFLDHPGGTEAASSEIVITPFHGPKLGFRVMQFRAAVRVSSQFFVSLALKTHRQTVFGCRVEDVEVKCLLPVNVEAEWIVGLVGSSFKALAEQRR